jgi:hypothetical protein
MVEKEKVEFDEAIKKIPFFSKIKQEALEEITLLTAFKEQGYGEWKNVKTKENPKFARVFELREKAVELAIVKTYMQTSGVIALELGEANKLNSELLTKIEKLNEKAEKRESYIIDLRWTIDIFLKKRRKGVKIFEIDATKCPFCGTLNLRTDETCYKCRRKLR